MPATEAALGFAPRRAATGEELDLAMQSLWLAGRILPVGAHLVVRHTFRSQEQKPVEVIYSFALPRDAALRRFRVSGEGFSVRSELKPVGEAVRAYEEGLEEGHLATLARTYRDGIVNLTLGNLRPGETVTVLLEILCGVELHDDGLRFRFPFTLAPSYHARARVGEAAPGVGEIELPEDEFGDVILPRWAADASGLHEIGFRLTVEAGAELASVGSPSHAVDVRLENGRRGSVMLARERDVPNRDLVLDVRTREAWSGVLAGLCRQGKGHFAVVIPSPRFGARSEEPRSVVFVLDRSGSMSGAPIAQALKACEACLAALTPGDRFGLIAFDDQVEAFRSHLVECSHENRDKAREFLAGVDARGGTELAAGLEAAANMLHGGGGDIFLLTDGQVSGTESIIARACAAGIRIHCLGIGSASQDRFLALLARETGGVSRFLTPRERVDRGALELFAAVGRPVARDVTVETDGLPGARIEPEPARQVFSGTPLVIFGRTRGAVRGTLRVGWVNSGERRAMEIPVEIGSDKLGETLRLIRGARLISDWESRTEEPPQGGALDRRRQRRIQERLRRLSETYGLASREMALVAVVERPGDQPGELPKTTVVPVGMPEDVEFDSYFKEQAICFRAQAICERPIGFPSLSAEEAEFLRRFRSRAFQPECRFIDTAREVSLNEMEARVVRRVELALAIEPDGGMPGADDEERALASLLALLCFLAEGSTESSGPYRFHVRRLVSFLENVSLDERQRRIADGVIELARRGGRLPGNWWDLLKQGPSPECWDRIAEGLAKEGERLGDLP